MNSKAFETTNNKMKRLENTYNRYLMKIFSDVQKIVNQYYSVDDPLNIFNLTLALENYRKRLHPYAQKIAIDIIDKLSLTNLKAWQLVNKEIGKELQKSFKNKNSSIFQLTKALYNEEVDLIVTIPQDLAKKAQEWSLKAMTEGTRHEYIGEKISELANENEYIGRRIARTEIAKVNTILTKARAESVGIHKFIWRTARDRIVRDTHAHLEGQIFDFNNPPYIDGEGVHLPGAFPNCRCYAEPIIVN